MKPNEQVPFLYKLAPQEIEELFSQVYSLSHSSIGFDAISIRKEKINISYTFTETNIQKLVNVNEELVLSIHRCIDRLNEIIKLYNKFSIENIISWNIDWNIRPIISDVSIDNIACENQKGIYRILNSNMPKIGTNIFDWDDDGDWNDENNCFIHNPLTYDNVHELKPVVLNSIKYFENTETDINVCHAFSDLIISGYLSITDIQKINNFHIEIETRHSFEAHGK
jgi:hypothetical protein